MTRRTGRSRLGGQPVFPYRKRMLPSPLATVSWLADHLDDPRVRVLDARFVLTDPEAGPGAYADGHVPGASYVHLERDLSAPKRPGGAGGRHPLPDPVVLAARLGGLGIGNGTWVVVYDDPRGGQGMYAARAWWLLRWLGHAAVAVLDGGWPAWLAAGGPVSTDVPHPEPTPFEPRVQEGWVVTAEEVASRAPDSVLIDSRARPRYLGEVEPIDPKAGHVPGAANVDWAASLDEEGHFRPAEAQRERFRMAEGRELIVYCGSGVSAAANVLALSLAGRPPGAETRLYAGSWSDWVSDPSRPVATGEERAEGQD